MKLMPADQRRLLRERFRRNACMRTLPKMRAAPSMAAQFIADAPIDPESPLPFVLCRLLDLEDEVERLRAELERLRAEVERLRPVVDAAIAWRRQFGEFGPADCADTPTEALSDAVDALLAAAQPEVTG